MEELKLMDQELEMENTEVEFEETESGNGIAKVIVVAGLAVTAVVGTGVCLYNKFKKRDKPTESKTKKKLMWVEVDENGNVIDSNIDTNEKK